MLQNAMSMVKKRVELISGTELEKKVKEATSNENWGASSTLKNEIARATFDYEGYKEVMPLLWKRMTPEDGKSWRVVFKSLVLLEHLLRIGSPRVIQDAQDRMYNIRGLQDFRCVEEGKDRGEGIREQAKRLIDLLKDEGALKEARDVAKSTMNKVGAQSSSSSNSSFQGFGSESSSRYDDDRRFTSREYDYDTRDSRDTRSGGRSSKPEYGFDDDSSAKKSTKKKDTTSTTKTKKKETKPNSDDDEETEKKKTKKKTHKKKEESEEEASEASEPDSDTDKKKKKKSKDKEEKKPKASTKIKVKLADKPTASSNGAAAKGIKLAPPTDDSNFDASFDEVFPEEEQAPPARPQQQQQAQRTPKQSDWEANFDFDEPAGNDGFGGFASATPSNNGFDAFSTPSRPIPSSTSFTALAQRQSQPVFQQLPQQQHQPQSGGGFFDMMDQPLSSQQSRPQVNNDFDIIGAVSSKPQQQQQQHQQQQQGRNQQQQQHRSDDGLFTDFTSASSSSAPSNKPSSSGSSAPSKKDAIWDSGLVNLSNLSINEKPKEAQKQSAASSGPSIDLGPSRRIGGPMMPTAPSGPSNNSGANSYGFDSLLGGPSVPPPHSGGFGGGGFGQPMGGGGFGQPMGGGGFGQPMGGGGFGQPYPMYPPQQQQYPPQQFGGGMGMGMGYGQPQMGRGRGGPTGFF